MKRTASVVLVLVLAGVFAGILLDRSLLRPGMAGHTDMAAADSAADSEREILYWVAPMDAAYRRDGPGKSPMGMDLVPVYADTVDSDPAVVRVPAGVQANFGVRTAVAQRSRLARAVVATGQVAWDEERYRRITPRAEGWIQALGVAAAGDRVTAGQELYRLFSPALVNAQEEFLATLSAGDARLRAAAADRLRALGFTAADIDHLQRTRQVRRDLPVTAQRDGVVVELMVRNGDFVTPGRPLLTLADTDQVWVRAQVVERQAGWVQPGQPADVALTALPYPVRRSSVELVHPALDPRTRTLPVRLRLDNPDGALRPGMLADVTIRVPPTQPLVHVPRAAVIRSGTANRVVLDLGEGRFRVQPVLVGYEANDRIVVREGLAEGDRVVVSGQFLIDSEADVGTALGRLNGSSTP